MRIAGEDETTTTRATPSNAHRYRPATPAAGPRSRRPVVRGSRPQLVSAGNFVLATRDTGYTSTAQAVAEFVNNSLQAGAGSIAVEVLATNDNESPIEVLVTDDGTGMDAATLSSALTSADRAATGRGPSASEGEARRLLGSGRDRSERSAAAREA